MADTDWVGEARELFRTARPAHFTNYTHCCECQEHDETLQGTDIDTIGMDELGNPGWDPMCFVTPDARKYYFPALVRLSLETLQGEGYITQLLFHLQWDGQGNEFFNSCDTRQRQFVVRFIEFLVENYPEELDNAYCADDALSVLQIWSAPPSSENK